MTFTCLFNYFFICIEICYTFPFTLSHVSHFLLTVLTTTTTIILYTSIGPIGVSVINANFSCPRGFCFVWINASSSYPSTAVSFIICLRLLLKVSNFFPISSLILFMFVAWLFIRTSAKFPWTLACFIVNFSRMYEKHALIVLLLNSADDCSSWQLDGLWKSDGILRLTLVEFSAISTYISYLL